MRSILLLCLATIGLFSSLPVSYAKGFDHDHGAFATLLDEYSNAGVVDYAPLQRRGRQRLKGYLRTLALIHSQVFDQWDAAQQVAFLVNAYNAATIELVLQHYPIDSIRDIGWLPGAPFREEFIYLPATGKTAPVSLDFIEHEVLRRRFNEPRIHFALVCASRGCPPLRPEPYRPTQLDAQLSDQARAFLADTRQNRFDSKGRRIMLSKIFDWFAEDFERTSGSVLRFIAPLAPAAAAEVLNDRAARTTFLDYDWRLNDR